MLTATYYTEKHCLHSARSLRTGASSGGSEEIRWQLAVANLGSMKMCNETFQSEGLTGARENEGKMDKQRGAMGGRRDVERAD